MSEQEPKIEKKEPFELTDSELEIVLDALRRAADYSSGEEEEKIRELIKN